MSARGRLRAEAALLHHLDQLALRDPRRRLGLLVNQPRVAIEVELLALFQFRDLLVLRAAVGVDGGEAGVDDDRAAHEVGLGAGFDVGARGLGDHRRAEGRKEAADDEFVDAALGALEGVRVDGLRRVDRRVVRGLFFPAGRFQLGLLEDARGRRELLQLDQRGDQVLHRQRRRIDRVVGARIGDEAVHVEVLGNPHGAGGGHAEPARGVRREGGGVVGRRRAAGVRAAVDRHDGAGAGGPDERSVRLLLLPEFVRGVVSLKGSIGMLELVRTAPRTVSRRGRGAPSRARPPAPASGSGRARRRGSWSRSGAC